MNALPDLNTYQDPEVLTPEDAPDEDLCQWCGNYFCTPDCAPRFVSPYRAARSRGRRENGDPES